MDVTYEKKGKIAVFTMNRPQAMNSLGGEVVNLLLQSLLDFRDDPALWVGVLTGSGDKAFCVGADLKSWAQSGLPRMSREGKPDIANTWHQLTHSLKLYKPLIAAVNGYALGGGLELMLLCDIRIAAEHARFGLPEIKRGFMPGGGGTQRLIRMLNWCHAAQILLTGKPLSAEDAYRVGLVNQVVPLERLMPTALEWAEGIAEAAPVSVRAVKEAMARGINLTLEDALAMERELTVGIRNSEDFAEGVRAFAEKRTPQWKGR